jgi:MFS family permease
MFAILLVFAVRELDLSPGLIGVVFSIGALGSLAGAVTATRLSRRFGIGPTTIAMSLMWGPATLLFALAPAGTEAVPFLIAGLVIFSFSGMTYNIVQVSYRQAICPPRLQGRMNSVMRFIVWGTIPLGTLLGGALATWIGFRETIVISAIGGTSAVLWIVFSPQRHLRDMPEPVDDAAATETGLEEAVPSLSA